MSISSIDSISSMDALSEELAVLVPFKPDPKPEASKPAEAKDYLVAIGAGGRPVINPFPFAKGTLNMSNRSWGIGKLGPQMAEYVVFAQNGALHQYFNEAAGDVVGHHNIPRSHMWDLQMMVKNYPAFRAWFDDEQLGNVGSEIAEQVESLFAEILKVRSFFVERVKKDSARGVVEYEDLGYFFNIGEKVYGDHKTGLVGGPILDTNYVQTYDGSRFFIVKVEIIHQYGAATTRGAVTLVISAFGSERKIADLPVQKLEGRATIMSLLTERGEKFRKFSQGPYYVKSTGQITVRTYWGDRNFRAEGRAMVDAKMATRIAKDKMDRLPELLLSGSGRRYRDDENEAVKDIDYVIPDDERYMTMPTLFGFSMSAKTWGELEVDKLEEIEWNDNAFDYLVLEDDLKDMTRALVENHSGSFEDIVQGKGGGVIFLLHGVPGVGKTLTAETVAELLHRPLYSVSVGELGTNPDLLEERLREILDVATAWDAVLLLDEADIFLEARDEHDILRNAMVGVFLRLLEYHQGVLFLTTNRVKNIDRAFYSRISIGIKYEGAEAGKRRQIWVNLSTAAKYELTESELDKLAQIDLNGRQIKNVLRLSQTLSKAQDKKPSFDQIDKIIARVQKFERDINFTGDDVKKSKKRSKK